MDRDIGKIETARQPGAALVSAHDAFGFGLRRGRVDYSGGAASGWWPNPTWSGSDHHPQGGAGTPPPGGTEVESAPGAHVEHHPREAPLPLLNLSSMLIGLGGQARCLSGRSTSRTLVLAAA